MKTKNTIAPTVSSTGLLGLVADIRAAVGDPTGKLMQDELVEHCRKIAHSEEWNRCRVEMLSKLQKHMRDPERTLVCDVLANGQLLPDPQGKRYGFATTGNEHFCMPTIKMRDRHPLNPMPKPKNIMTAENLKTPQVVAGADSPPSPGSAYSTTEITETGWYWFLIDESEVVLKVVISERPVAFDLLVGSWRWVVDLALGGAKWSGPIISPNTKMRNPQP